MSNVLSSLLIELGVNTASMESGLTKATYLTKQWGRETEDTFKKAANSISNVTVAFGAFGPAGAAISEVLLKMGEAVGSTTAKFASINPVLGVFTGSLAAVAAGAAAATAAIVGMAVKTAETTDKMFHQSEIAGASFESFQKLAAGARMYEISGEELSMSLARMSRQAITAAESTNYSATQFGRMGINVKDSSGHLKDSVSLFEEAIDKLSRMSNETERDALAQEVLSRSAMRLIPALSGGVNSLLKYGDAAERVGWVLSTETGEAAHQFSAEMEMVGIVTEAAQRQISVGIVALTQLLQLFTDAYNGGELFNSIGVTVGEGLHGLATTVAYTAYGVHALGVAFVELDGFLIKLQDDIKEAEFAVPRFGIGTKEARDAFDAQKAQVDAIVGYQKHKLEESKKDMDKFLADMANPPASPKGGLGGPEFKPNLGVRAMGGLGIEPDLVKEFVDKLDLGVKEQLDLAAAVDRTVAALAMQKAAADAEKAIAEKRLELEQKIDEMSKQRAATAAQMKGTGVTDDALIGYNEQLDRLDKGVANFRKQLKELDADAARVNATFASTAVLTSLNEMNKSVIEATDSIDQQIAEQERLIDLQSTSAVDKFFDKADEKAKKFVDSLRTAQDEQSRLQNLPFTSGELPLKGQTRPVALTEATPEQLAGAKRLVDSIQAAIPSIKLKYETSDVLGALDEVNSQINKATISLGEEYAEQQLVSESQRKGGGAEAFAKYDEKVKDAAVALADAVSYYELSLGPDTKGIEDAKKQVDELTAKLAGLRAGFEAVGVREAANAAGASVQKSLDEATAQVAGARRLNAAKLQGPAALGAAQVEDKLRPEDTQLQDLREQYAQLQAAPPTPENDQKVKDTGAAISALEDKINTLREAYRQLAEADPDYWNKLRGEADKAQEQFGTFSQAVHGFVDSLANQGKNFQLNFFDELDKGFGSLEANFAKFMVEGKRAGESLATEFRSSLASIGEGLVRLVVQFAVAKAAALAMHLAESVPGVKSVTGAVGGVLNKVTGAAGAATKDVGQVANTTAVTANTAALTALATSLGVSVSATAATIPALGANTAATTTNTAATWSHISAIFAHIAVTIAHIGVMLAHMAVLIANTIAIIANTIVHAVKALFGLESGGPAEAGVPYIVGEKRPELFVPKTSGTVIPFVPSAYKRGVSLTEQYNFEARKSAARAALALSGHPSEGGTEAMSILGVPAAVRSASSSGSVLHSVGASVHVGAREFGGPVTAGESYITGERRPELFVPSAGGSTRPNPTAQGGHTVHVNTSINTIDASGFDDLLEKHGRVVARHVDTALRKTNLRI